MPTWASLLTLSGLTQGGEKEKELTWGDKKNNFSLQLSPLHGLHSPSIQQAEKLELQASVYLQANHYRALSLKSEQASCLKPALPVRKRRINFSSPWHLSAQLTSGFLPAGVVKSARWAGLTHSSVFWAALLSAGKFALRTALLSLPVVSFSTWN